MRRVPYSVAFSVLLLGAASCAGTVPAACTPTCPAATCGDDGCGGTCACSAEAYCDSHQTCQTTAQCKAGEFMPVPGTCRLDFRGDYSGTSLSLRFLSDDGLSYVLWGSNSAWSSPTGSDNFFYVGRVDGNSFNWQWCNQEIVAVCRQMSGVFDPPGTLSGHYASDVYCGVHCPGGISHDETDFVATRVGGT